MSARLPYQDETPFTGRFKGMPFPKIPTAYLLWMIRDRHQQAHLAERELERRARVARGGKPC